MEDAEGHLAVIELPDFGSDHSYCFVVAFHCDCVLKRTVRLSILFSHRLRDRRIRYGDYSTVLQVPSRRDREDVNTASIVRVGC